MYAFLKSAGIHADTQAVGFARVRLEECKSADEADVCSTVCVVSLQMSQMSFLEWWASV